MNNKDSLAYLNFINLVQGLQQSDIPALDPSEEKLLNSLGNVWNQGIPVTVRDGMELMPDVSIGTTHRRLKSLRSKGLLDLVIDGSDNRVKYIISTPLASKYFSLLGKCLKKALKSS